MVQARELESNVAAMRSLKGFLCSARLNADNTFSAVSLFSGAGISDLGFEQAGFNYVVQAEIDPNRAELCKSNFPRSNVIVGDIRNTQTQVVDAFLTANVGELSLLAITPPCQGMSSSNPGRGKKIHVDKRDGRNRLLLDVIPIITALMPRLIVVENVTELLSEVIIVDGIPRKVLDVFESQLNSNYALFVATIQTADYGIPQTRKRAIIVAIRRDELGLNTLYNRNLVPIPRARHRNNWITVEQWFRYMRYQALDSKTKVNARSKFDNLHFVPSYEKDPQRYTWIEDIPPSSGQNAYSNANCRECGFNTVPEGVAFCTNCFSPMTNRPYVKTDEGIFRLIKGFHSSYRRMYANRPASTVMTNSSHLGGDYKIHPWENRVLSLRECAELQTVPRFYNWQWALTTRHNYTIREVVGEALPTYFTYLQGTVLKRVLLNRIDARLFERLSE